MRAVTLGLLVSLGLAGPAHAAQPDAAFVARVGEAIAREVGSRMGPGVAVRVEQDVARLDVAMHQPGVMRSREPTPSLDEDVDRLAPSPGPRLDPRPQRPTAR